MADQVATHGHRSNASGGAAMDSELVVAEQIARLFDRRAGVVWELVAAGGPARRDAVPIRDSGGALVAWARPAD